MLKKIISITLFISIQCVWSPLFSQETNVEDLGLDSGFKVEEQGSDVKAMEENVEDKKEQRQKSNLETSTGIRNLNTFFKGKSSIENPFGLRDPFKRQYDRTGKKRKQVGEKGKTYELVDGVYTNVKRIEDQPIDRVKIVGVLIGRERRAIAEISGSSGTYILKEGMKLGKDSAEIKAILPGGIVLVEKIINVYGQQEYLETIIPISTDQ